MISQTDSATLNVANQQAKQNARNTYRVVTREVGVPTMYLHFTGTYFTNVEAYAWEGTKRQYDELRLNAEVAFCIATEQQKGKHAGNFELVGSRL